MLFFKWWGLQDVTRRGSFCLARQSNVKHREIFLRRRYECIGVKWNFRWLRYNAKQTLFVHVSLTCNPRHSKHVVGKFWLAKWLLQPSHNLHGPKLCALFHCPVILRLYNLKDEGSRTFADTVCQTSLNLLENKGISWIPWKLPSPSNTLHWAGIYVKWIWLLKKLLNTTLP